MQTFGIDLADLGAGCQNRMKLGRAQFRCFFKHIIEVRFLDRRGAEPDIRLRLLRAGLVGNAER